MTMNFNRNGGGGTTDYSALTNKPSINDVTLVGNKTASDLGLMPSYEVDDTPTEDSENLVTSGGVYEANQSINGKLQGSKTASSTDGSPFEIPDYGLTESIDMYFKPTQDLHGYDKPWAGGAGKNKVKSISDNPSTAQYATILYVDIDFEPSTIYTMSFEGTGGNHLYTNENLVVEPVFFEVESSGRTIVTFTTKDSLPSTEHISAGWAFLKNAENLSSPNTFNDVMIEQGSTATDFEPYSNICPISGQNNAKFEWTGKNKFGGTYDEFFPLHFNVDTTVVASCDEVSDDVPQIAFYDENENQLDYWGMSTEYSAITGRMARSFTLPKEAYFVKFINAEAQNYQIEIASVNTAYARYIHGEVEMNFGKTCYGGFCQFNGQVFSQWSYIASYNGETLSGEWVSDRDEYQAGTTPTIGAEVAYENTPATDYFRVTPPANLSLTDDYPIEYNGWMAQIQYQPKNTVLEQAKQYTNQEIAKLGFPTPPTTDGTYHLECSVSGGIPTISWVANI